jgi:mannosyltransferase OCH1-like enzyme
MQYPVYYMWNFKPDEKLETPGLSCIKHNTQFYTKYTILGPQDIEPLLTPELRDLWDKIPHWVIKADLGRLLYIYHHGGIYLDVDCSLRRRLPVVENEVILFVEHVLPSVQMLGPRECKDPDNVVRIANFAFGTAIPQHPFLKLVIDECVHRLQSLNQVTVSQSDILWVCGPDVITSIYHKTKKERDDICLLDKTYLTHLRYGSWRT